MFIEKLKAPSRSALLRGLAFHFAVAGNYEQKVESEQDLPISDVLDIFGTQFDLGVPDTVWFSDEKPGVIKDSGYNMLTAYQKVIAPKVQPIEVEMEFQLKLKGTDQIFTGRVDTITKEEIIIDQKTKKARPSSIDVDHKIQLTAYTAGFQVKHQRKPKGTRLDYIVDKKEPECLSYDMDIQDTDIHLLLTLIAKYQEAIKIGLDIPNRASFLCSKKYCSFAYECEARYGGTVKE